MQLVISRYRHNTPVDFIVPLEEETELTLDGTLYELDQLSFAVHGVPFNQQVSLAIQDEVILEPKQWADPAEGQSSIYQWPIRGGGAGEPYFSRYAGFCSLIVRLYHGDELPSREWKIRVNVVPSKITRTQYRLLVAEIDSLARGLLYDLYAKAVIGVKRGDDREFSAEEQLEMIRKCVEQVSQLLRRLALRPERRLRQRPTIINARTERPDSAFSVAWVTANVDCLRPAAGADSFLINGKSLAVDRFKALEAEGTHDIYEHQVLAGFLLRLENTLDRIIRLARRDWQYLLDEKDWKDIAPFSGEPSWWESENKPRMKEAQVRIVRAKALKQRLGELSRVPFLQAVSPRKEAPRMTPLFRDRDEYSGLFRLMREFYRGAQISFGSSEYLLRMKDLPTLYEYWCFLQIAGALAQQFELVDQEAFQLDEERYIISLPEDQPLVYRGERAILNLYYQRRYEPRAAAQVPYGRRGGPSAYLPDVACEIFFESSGVVPDFVYVFDAKYQKNRDGGPPHGEVSAVSNKYLHGIIRFDDHSPIVRHCWLLYPGDTNEPDPGFDNFFGPTFKAGRCSLGAIPMQPGEDLAALDKVLSRFFELDGVG